MYISCHVHVKAARSGRAALELLAVRKGWGYTNNEHIHAHLQKRTALSTLDSFTNPKLQLLCHAQELRVESKFKKLTDSSRYSLATQFETGSKRWLLFFLHETTLEFGNPIWPPG